MFTELAPNDVKDDIDNLPSYKWLISSDKIFSSKIEKFTNCAEFLYMEFQVARFGTFEGNKFAESIVSANDVKIYMRPGSYCAAIQGKMAAGTVISKITLQKIVSNFSAVVVLEEKTFSSCVIQSFSRIKETVCFSFRYASYSDSYTDYGGDGSKIGTSAVNVDVTKWEIKES